MKLYFALAALTAVYAAAIMPATDPYAVLWNGVVGAMLSIALILSVIPAAGPLIYEVALRALSNSLHVDLGPVYTLLRAASWAINIIFTAALALYLLQWQRARARRVIRLLLW